MATPFVLLSTQRSGSTWVIDMLNSHPGIVAYSELFLENGRGTPTWGGATEMPFWDTYRAEIGPDAPETGDLLSRYLDDVFRARNGTEAVGFKLMYGQAGAWPGVVGYMQAHRVRIAHLIRRNFLDTIISKETAVARDVFHARADDEVPVVQVRLDTSNLVRRLREEQGQVAKASRKFSGMGLPYLEVFYEDLVGDTDAFEPLLRFLDIEAGAGQMTSKLRQLNTGSQARRVANYEDVQRVLAGTEFAALLR